MYVCVDARYTVDYLLRYGLIIYLLVFVKDEIPTVRLGAVKFVFLNEVLRVILLLIE